MSAGVRIFVAFEDVIRVCRSGAARYAEGGTLIFTEDSGRRFVYRMISHSNKENPS